MVNGAADSLREQWSIAAAADRRKPSAEMALTRRGITGRVLLRQGLLFCVSVRALGADSTIVSATMADYISVSEALKLVSPFKEEKGRY